MLTWTHARSKNKVESDGNADIGIKMHVNCKIISSASRFECQ